MISPSLSQANSARSAGIIEITMAVYSFILNDFVFFGNKEACEALESTNSSLVALEL